MNNNPDKNPRYDIRGLYDLVTEVGRQTKNPYPLSFQDFSRVMQKESNRRGLYDKLSKRAGIGGTYEDFENAFFNPYASETNQVEALRNKTFTLDPRKEMARHRALLDASEGKYNPYGTSEVSYNPDRRMRGTNIAPIDLVDSEDTLPESVTSPSDGPKKTRTFWGGVVSGARGIHGGAQIAVADLLKGFGGNSDDEKEAIHLINQMEQDGTLSLERVRGLRERLLKDLDSYTNSDIRFSGDYSKKARQADALKLIEERMQRMGQDLTPEKRAIALDAMRSDLREKGSSEDKANPFVRWKENAKDYMRKSEVPEGTWAELGSATASVGGALAGQAISMIPGAAPIGQAISWASIGAQTISSGGQAIMDMEDYAAEKGVYITPEEKATIALGYMAAEFGGDALGGAVASKSISAIGKLAGGGRIGQKLAVRSLAKGIAGNEGVRQSLSRMSEYAQKPLAIPLAKSAGRQIVRGAVTEGPGESLTTLMQNGALDRVWKDKEDQEAWADVARQAVKDGIYGAWAGALMGGFGSAIQSGQVAHMHRKEGLTLVQDEKNNLYEVIGADQSSYLVLDRAGRQKMLPADQVVDAIHYTPEERQKSQKAYDEATEGLHPKEEVLTENQKRAGAILSATEQQQSPIYRATHPEVSEEDLNSPVALAGAKKALADVLEGQNEEVKARVDQMALVLRDGEADPTEELTKLFSDESLSDNDRQSILDVVTAQSRLTALERSHQEAMAQMQSELTKEWSAKSVVGDESARGSVISATMTDADGKPKQVYVTGGVRVMTNEDGTVELLPTDDGAPIYVYDESVDGEENGHIVQMDDLSSPQLVAEDYLDLVQAAVDEADAAFLNEVQQAEEQATEEQASQSEEGDAGDTTDDFMQSLPRTREGEVDGLRLMSERPDDFIRYLGQLYGEDFVASLPMSKKGALDLKALTPEQTLKINEAALGKSGAVEAARQRRSQVGAERAKLEAEVKNDLGNLEKRMALRKASEEYRLYDDYVRTAEEQARQEQEARRRAEEEALTPEERARREEEKRRKEQEIKDREERIRLENERRRREREELERNANGSTVREYTEDPPRQARARGARLVNGEVVRRQEPMTVEHYADAERAFSQRPGETRVPVKRTIVEAESLQASHKEGRMNPKHFIPEAQPKDRADNGLSSTAADRIASDIRPDEITGGITAYTGAPVVNGRGEVIQGNNRTDALQTMYDGAERHTKSAERYKEYLKAHASEYGMTAEQVEAMAHPVAVDVAEVSDSEAIRLGHRGQTDLESAGTDTMNAQTVGEELNSDTDPQSGQSMLVSFFNRIFNRTGANGAELSAKMDNMLNRNAEEGLQFLHENGYITDTQYKNAFETNSEGKRVVTAEAKTALKDVALYQLADVIGPRAMDIFYRLPASARNGLATFLYRDSQASFETSLAPDLGDALLVWDSLRQDPDFAGLTNFENAKIFILGKVSLFGRSELETNLGEASSLAKLLAASLQTQTEEQIASVLNQYYDLVGANETGAKTQSLMPTSQPTDTKAGAAEAVYGRVYEVPSGREKHYRFRRDGVEDSRRDVAEDFRARRDALADRITEERRKYAAAMDMARTLGVPLKLHEDMSTLPEEVRAGFDETHFVKGWFYKGDDAVHIYLPANVDADDVRATFLHEAAGHYGCRELLGEVGYNQVLDNLANKLGEEEVLRAMKEYCNGSQDLTDLGQVRIAMDEWIAHRAESGITKKTVWESIKDFFHKVFGLSGKQIDQSAEMMADDLLRRSAENLQKRAERQQGVATEEAEVKSEVRFRARKANGEEVDLPGVSYSDVRDHRGHRFVKASDGSIDFGEIREETGLTPGKIRLSEGFQSEYAGYGLLHMERPERKEQILKAGFSSAVNFAEYVAKNYTAIFRGKDRENGKPTYILQAPTSKNNILYVELSPEDGYWDINSGGPFGFTYTKNKENVWSLPALGHTLVTGGMEFSAQQTGGRQSGNSPQTISLDDKGTESSVYNQNDESEKRFRRAEREGNVSGAAEAVSDFMRNATPKNTSVDDVLRFLRVYHNSPHLLKKADGSFVDPETGERLGFDHRFIGSGEGFQAHGWGSYFSVKDLADYASTNDGDTYDGIKITKNDKYVISKGGDTNTSLILFQAIRMGYRTNTAPQAEDTIAKFVEEKLSELSESQERRLAKQKRLLDALKGNEPWAMTTINSRWGKVITDPKTGYEYDTTYSLEESKQETYERIKEEAKKYRDALEFIERNPDYVKNFTSRAVRHKYQVEIPNPQTNRYLEEGALLTKEEESRIREAASDTKRIKYHRLNEERLEGRKVWEVYDLLSNVLNGADKASALLNKAGFVGIHYNGRIDGECYVIFNENDAKITDLIRFRRREAHLAGVHTLTTDNLRHALKMGGLANPSIAVYDTERGLPTRTFGEVALIAPHDLVDAKTGRHKGTYNRDAWTPPYPQVSYELTKRGEDALRSLSDKVRNLGDVASARLLMNEANQSDLSPATLETRLRTNEGVRKLYESEHRGEDYDSYVSSLTKSIEMEDFLFAGQRADGSWKRVPHTLDNVSKLMKRERAEGSKAYPFAYALSKLGSRYRSLSAIRKGEDLLSGKDPAKWEAIRKEFIDLANELQGEAKSLFDIRGEEHLAALLADGKNLFGRPLTVTEEARVSALREQMTALPTDYFETKVDRPVGLSEFVEAVVPDGTSPELVSELEKSGLKVSTYDSSKDGALNAAVLSAMDRADATDRGVRFRTGELNIEEVNRTFNEELEKYVSSSNHTTLQAPLTLGMPSSVLLSCGLPLSEITLPLSVIKKALVKHHLKLADLRNLPKALIDPLLVYEWGTKARSMIIVTDLNVGDNKLTVAIKIERGGRILEINEIASIHDKVAGRFLEDMTTATDGGLSEALRYVRDKKKALDWLGIAPPRGASAQANPKLSDIANIINGYENPKIEKATHTDPEHRFRRAEREGDVSGAAEAASDFMRNATPKNTSVDDVLRFLRVYHNSPHLLKKADGAFVDPESGERLGFDHRFMGSGEGNQAHGWGSYFSVKDLEGYGQTEQLIPYEGMPEMTISKDDLSRYTDEQKRWAEMILDLYNDGEGDVGNTFISPLERLYADRSAFDELYDSQEDANTRWDDFVDFYKNRLDEDVRPFHNKYVVEIPNLSDGNYLEEDVPLSERQASAIKQTMEEKSGDEYDENFYSDFANSYPDWNALSGGNLYKNLSDYLLKEYTDSPSQAAQWTSEMLNEAGFVGIHYNGQRDGECYVIFNENDAKITDHVRYRRTERTEPKSMSDPINPQWNGEWYSPEDLTGKSTADLLDLPTAPATPEKRPTQSVAEYAETMSRHYADPRVRFRTGAHKESLMAPKPPKITDGMSLYEVAQLQHEYNRNYRDYLSSSMKRMDALVTTKGRFIRYMVDSARPVELFCKEMERMGIGMTPEQNVYQDLMTQSSRELNMRKQEVEPLVTKLTDRIRDLREQKLLDKVMDVSYTFTDEDTNETKTIKRADGYDKVSLYFQAKDIVECEQLGLVSRGREGFEKVVTEFDNPSNHITPEAYIASFEEAVGKANAEALCDDMRKMSRWSIDRLHGAGLMTDDQYRSLTQSPRRYYAPQRGFKVTEESDRNAYERVEMTAEGRQSLSGDPIAYMQAIMNTTVMRVVRNQDLLHLYEWVTQHQQELARRGVLEIGETYYRKSGVDEKGNPIYTPSKQAPTIEELRHDSDARRQIAKLRMEQKRLDQSHDKGETADYVYGIKSKEISNKISDLNNSIEILYRDPKPLRGDSKEQDETLRRTVKVYKDGVEQQIHFSPQYRGELVADVLNGRPSMDQDTKFYRSVGRYLENAGAINYVSKATRFMSALMTQYNPNFAVTNALRDYGTALISNVSDFGWGYQRAFMANYAKVQKTVLKYTMSDAYSDGTYPPGKYGTYLKEFFDEGAATGWSFLPDVVKIRQTMKEMSDPTLKQKFVNGKYGVVNAFGLKQGIGMLTEASELNTRFAEYVTSRERGFSSKEAAKHAKELTVNFNRKGTLAGVFGSFFGFWNASIQGTNKIVRLGRHGAEWCGTLFAGGIAQGLLYALGAPDKDDERAFTEWEMMTNICIGDLKVPLPQGFRGFWGAGVQMALALAGKKDWQGGVIDGTQYLIGELLPSEAASLSNIVEWDDVTGNVELNTTKVLRDAIPTAVQPEMDVILNMDFMGNPVYREPFIKGQEGQIAQRTLGKKRTKQVYKDLSDKIWYTMGGSLERNDRMSRDGTHILPDDVLINPSVIEHVFEGRTTGIGKTMADIATCVSAASSEDPSELRKLQIVNVLTKQEKDYSDSDRSYWKLMDFYNSRQQTMSNLRKAKEGEDVERYKKMTERVDAMAPQMTGEQLTEKIWADGTQDEKLYVTWLETKALLKQIDKGKVTKEEVAPTIDRLTEQFRELR